MATPEKDRIVAEEQDRASARASFGRRVRELRKAQGYSQERFAILSGLDRSYFGAVERGERNVSLDNIAAIARALNVPVKELFPAEEPPPEL
jgi:transcriptional regulator with XRE-family HTH domain